jgi:hypothetical protein
VRRWKIQRFRKRTESVPRRHHRRVPQSNPNEISGASVWYTKDLLHILYKSWVSWNLRYHCILLAYHLRASTSTCVESTSVRYFKIQSIQDTGPNRLLSNHAHQSVELGFFDRRNTSSISLSSISSSPLTSPKRCSLPLFDIKHNLSIVNFLQTKCHHHHRGCMSILAYLPTLTPLQTMSQFSNGSVKQKLFAPSSLFLDTLHYLHPRQAAKRSLNSPHKNCLHMESRTHT